MPDELLVSLLQYDLLKFGEKLGLSREPIANVPTNLVAASLNRALLKANGTSTSELLESLTISGLIWEYRNSEWNALKPILTTILSRLGLAPSAYAMLSEEGKLESSGSYLTDLINAAAFLPYEVEVLYKKVLLTRQQYLMWKGLEQHPIYGISAPTSAGKSFVITLKLIDLIHRFGGSVVYIVPTISLITQVTRDIKKALKEYGINNYFVSQSVSPEIGAAILMLSMSSLKKERFLHFRIVIIRLVNSHYWLLMKYKTLREWAMRTKIAHIFYTM